MQGYRLIDPETVRLVNLRYQYCSVQYTRKERAEKYREYLKLKKEIKEHD